MLKQTFMDVQADCKLLAAELKWACADHLTHTQQKFENVKLFDTIAAVKTRIKVLMAQEKLAALGKKLKIEYMKAFMLIPHLDNLPMCTAT